MFIGRLSHWLIIVAFAFAFAFAFMGWITGLERQHVIHFNVFIITTNLLPAVSMVIVLKTSTGGHRITRDEMSWTMPKVSKNGAWRASASCNCCAWCF